MLISGNTKFVKYFSLLDKSIAGKKLIKKKVLKWFLNYQIAEKIY